MSDWADEIGQAFIDNLDANELDLIEGPEAPFRRLAALLRKAKADGMREAASIADWHESDMGHGVPTVISNQISARAAEIEKGNA